MKKTPLVYLDDMVESASLIEEYVREMSWEQFSEDVASQDSVVRRFEIIGEAARNLTKQFRGQYPQIPWSEIVGLRNKLVHDYSDVNLETLWEIIQKGELKELKEKVREVIGELEELEEER